MDEKVLQLRVGIFVLLAIIILFALVSLNSEIWKSQYTVFIKPATAPGIEANTPVRKNGILIGRVRDVQAEDDHVLVTLRIDNDEQIYKNETARIGTESILGDGVIEIIPVPAAERGPALDNEDLIETVAFKRNPLELVDVALDLESQISETLKSIKQTAATFEETAQRIGEAGDDVSKLSQTVNNAFNDENSQVRQLIADFRTVSRKTNAALDYFNSIFENVNEVVGDPEFKNRFSEAAAALPGIFEEIRGAVADVRTTVTSFQKISDSADKNLQNLETFTASLKDNGPEILELINDRLANLDGVFEEIQKATKALANLNNGEGAIGKLLKDPELYDTAVEAVRNIRDQTAKLEPLMNDIRTFGDKIARDPGQLGVRGAISNRKAAGTGYKGTTGRERIQR